MPRALRFQRGVGRSWPSWAHAACVTGGAKRNKEGYLKTNPEGISAWTTDPSDPEDIRKFLQAWKKRVANCWTCEDCDYQLSAEQPDGTNNTYHFLEYSGTRQLAEDVDRFRKAIKAEKISLYGGSYGTTVMSTYATIFPESVGLFVIDSNTQVSIVHSVLCVDTGPYAFISLPCPNCFSQRATFLMLPLGQDRAMMHALTT
jgi:pimeloyl-ACP methyl ester carboxylesterase